jgi:hypothetical protein
MNPTSPDELTSRWDSLLAPYRPSEDELRRRYGDRLDRWKRECLAAAVAPATAAGTATSLGTRLHALWEGLAVVLDEGAERIEASLGLLSPRVALRSAAPPATRSSRPVELGSST